MYSGDSFCQRDITILAVVGATGMNGLKKRFLFRQVVLLIG